MKGVILILLAAVVLTDPIRLNKINTAKEEAKKAFQAGDYSTALQKYKYLVDSMGVKEDEVLLNMAHAYYLDKDTTQAFTTYQSVATSPQKTIRSKAQLQMGVMANQQGRAEEALNYFKQALKENPANEDARYNYEMLKKKLDEQKKQQQDQQQKKDQQNKDQQQEQKQKDQEQKDQQKKDDQKKEDQQKQDQQNKDQEQQKKEKQDQEQQQKEQDKEKQEQEEREKKDMQNLNKEKLEQMKISEEKARMILEAMKNQEKQYLQQQKRKATKSRDRSKPDW